MRTIFDRPFFRIPIPDRTKPPEVEWPPEVTPRHLSMAFQEQAMFIQSYGGGEAIAEPFLAGKLRELHELGDKHPAVQSIAQLIASQEALEERWAIYFSQVMGDEDDPEPGRWESFTEIERFMDGGAADGEKPSQIFELNRRLIDSEWVHLPVKSQRECRAARKDYERAVIRTARARYRAGFYADPFTKAPRSRLDG